MHVSLEVFKRHLLSHNNSILLTSNYSLALTFTHAQKKEKGKCTVLSFYTKPGMQCLWCIIKHEQRKPFLQRLCFFHFLVIIQRLHQAPDMHRILAEQIQRGFICSRTSVLVEPSPGAQSVTSRPGRFFYSITFFRRSIKQQQVLLVDKKQQFVSVFVPPLL